MSAPCPHCRRFREERDEALEALRQARAAAAERELEDECWAACEVFAIPPQSARLLQALLHARGEVVSKHYLAAQIVGDDDCRATPPVKLIDVYLVKLRRAVAPDIKIETVWGGALRFTKQARAAVRARLAEARA